MGGGTQADQIGHHVDFGFSVKYLECLVQRGHAIRLNFNLTLDAALRKERREVRLKAGRMVMRQLQ